MHPYKPYAQSELTRSVEHVVRVYAYDDDVAYNPIQLDLIDATLTYDEDHSPMIELRGSLQVPDQEMLDFLDPRKNIRLVVMAGYVYESGLEDVFTITDLHLRERTTNRPQNTLYIVATSDEALVQDYISTSTWTWTSSSNGGQSIAALIRAGVQDETYPVVIQQPSDARFVTAGDTMTLEPGGDLWSTIQTIADRLGLWVYHNGQGAFHVVPSPRESGASLAALRVGQSSNIIASQTLLGRENFANFIIVTYTGSDPVGCGWAQMTTGDFGTSTIGRKAIAVQIDKAGTNADAQAAAGAMLWRSMSRGRSMNLESAQAMYWLRPCDTITVQLPTGPQERHLIASVVYDLPGGTMNIKTRQPENVVITTGE